MKKIAHFKNEVDSMVAFAAHSTFGLAAIEKEGVALVVLRRLIDEYNLTPAQVLKRILWCNESAEALLREAATLYLARKSAGWGDFKKAIGNLPIKTVIRRQLYNSINIIYFWTRANWRVRKTAIAA